jgi:hypothetical protein
MPLEGILVGRGERTSNAKRPILNDLVPSSPCYGGQVRDSKKCVYFRENLAKKSDRLGRKSGPSAHLSTAAFGPSSFRGFNLKYLILTPIFWQISTAFSPPPPASMHKLSAPDYIGSSSFFWGFLFLGYPKIIKLSITQFAGATSVQNASDPSEFFDIEGGRWSRVDQSSASST